AVTTLARAASTSPRAAIATLTALGPGLARGRDCRGAPTISPGFAVAGCPLRMNACTRGLPGVSSAIGPLFVDSNGGSMRVTGLVRDGTSGRCRRTQQPLCAADEGGTTGANSAPRRQLGGGETDCKEGAFL